MVIICCQILLCACDTLQPMEIFVDDEAKLTLHGLVQHYIMLQVILHYGYCYVLLVFCLYSFLTMMHC